MKKREVLDTLGRVAFAAELVGADDIKPQQFSNAAFRLRSEEGDLLELAKSGALDGRRDVPKAVKAALGELADNGAIARLTELEAEIPEELFLIRRIKGHGPKKVRQLWRELDITTLGELEYACNENRLIDLKGFGQKTQDKVLTGLAELRQNLKLRRLDQALRLGGSVSAKLKEAGVDATLVGAASRAAEICEELEFLTLAGADAVHEALGDLASSDVDEVERGGFAGLAVTVELFPVRVFFASVDETMGAAEVLLSSSPEHADKLKAHAAARGLSLTSEGVHGADGEVIATPTDDEAYRTLGLLPVAHERREAPTLLVEEGKARPALLKREDLKGALHNHTVASDGLNTLEEMRARAAERGLSYLGISEHSQAAAYAGGLSEDELLAQREKVTALNQEGHNCALVHGVEADILKDGALDYPDAFLDGLDLVIASVHQRHRLDFDEATARLLSALASPAVDVLGHPTGRLLLGRAPMDYDVERVLDEAARMKVAVELNANPARLDLSAENLAAAKERGLLVSIAADAHSIEAIDHLEYGVLTARRAGLTPDDVLNTRSLDEVLVWRSERRAHARAQSAGAA